MVVLCVHAAKGKSTPLECLAIALKGCWNWGFTKSDTLFDTRQSVQLVTVKQLVEDLWTAVSQGFAVGERGNPRAIGIGWTGADAKSAKTEI